MGMSRIRNRNLVVCSAVLYALSYEDVLIVNDVDIVI